MCHVCLQKYKFWLQVIPVIFYKTNSSCRYKKAYKSNIQSILEIHSEIKATDFFLFFWENQKIISVMPVCSIHRLQRKKTNGYIQSSDIYVHILVTEMSPNGIRSEKMTCILQVFMVNFCTRWPISWTLMYKQAVFGPVNELLGDCPEYNLFEIWPTI